MKNIAIIPARSGSKGLKDKNIRKLNGKPLMVYTIEAAEKSGLFEKIIVSTDSQKYAEIAIEAGAEVPFLRDEKNATDHASSWNVVEEVIGKLEKEGLLFDTFALLQPTSPLRDSEDIRRAYEFMIKSKAESVVSVCETEHSPLWCNVLPEDGCLLHFIKAGANECRQALDKYYRINGAIYISTLNSFFPNKNIYGSKSYAFIMDNLKSIDIDTEMDFAIAEFLQRELK